MMRTTPHPHPANVSVVVPIFNESEGFDALREACSQLESDRWGDRYEIVLVDDGSSDDSWDRMTSWAEEDERVTLVRLASNRGAHRAGRAGIEASSGDVSVVIPADLQEGIDLVHSCVDRWHETGAPVVLMAPKTGRVYERFFDGWAARIFYLILRLSSRLYRNVPVRSQVKLLDRMASDAFARRAPATVLRAPFVLQQGFPFEVVEYEVQARVAGTSKWSFRRKLILVIDLLVDASSWLLSPWRVGALGFLLYAALEAAALGTGLESIRSMARTCFVGTTLVMLSILGMEVGRIHQELRGKPIYVIRTLRRGGTGEQFATALRESSNRALSVPSA